MFIYSINIFLRAFHVSGIVLCSRTMVLDSEVKVAQPCPSLYDSMNYTVHGILQARILEWIDFLFSGGSSQPMDWTQISRIEGGFFTSWATREAHGAGQDRQYSLFHGGFVFLMVVVARGRDWLDREIQRQRDRERKVTKEINRITSSRGKCCYSGWIWGSFMLGGQGKSHDEVNPGW